MQEACQLLEAGFDWTGKDNDGLTYFRKPRVVVFFGLGFVYPMLSMRLHPRYNSNSNSRSKREEGNQKVAHNFGVNEFPVQVYVSSVCTGKTTCTCARSFSGKEALCVLRHRDDRRSNILSTMWEKGELKRS